MAQGIEGLLLKHKGAKPLLNAREKQTIIEWLKQKDYWDLQELYSYIFIDSSLLFVLRFRLNSRTYQQVMLVLFGRERLRIVAFQFSF